ncbi:hypothetical protein [Caldimonas tepidiphila]|uniref:hypothetical protein n=1 Tax=Caldimonas tepidiphila TaxID=2315841 RepID=UPI000E5C3308|nr:hypothetical protein [Caldimonas tepidiphila]
MRKPAWLFLLRLRLAVADAGWLMSGGRMLFFAAMAVLWQVAKFIARKEAQRRAADSKPES